MASKSAEKLLRTNLKFLRGHNASISAIRSRRSGNASRIENKSFEKTKLFELVTRKKILPGSPESGHVLEKIIPSLSTPSLNYFVMQYLFSTKNQVGFDPVGALSHFVVPGLVAQSSSSELLESKEHIKQGQGHEGEISTSEAPLDPATGNVGEYRGIGTSRSYNPRLEILKRRAARRTSLDDPIDTTKQE